MYFQFNIQPVLARDMPAVPKKPEKFAEKALKHLFSKEYIQDHKLKKNFRIVQKKFSFKFNVLQASVSAQCFTY